jgi:hypothetical protein
MDDKTLQALTTLANKLGTTAEYLWGVLLRQAPLSGAIDLALVAAWAAACFWMVRFVRAKTAGDDPVWMDEAGRALAWAGVWFACLGVALIGGSVLTDAVTALANPEYWALRQILK